MRNSNASLFRRHAAAEEQMIRAAMPRTSDADLTPLRLLARREIVAEKAGSRLVKPLTYTLAEVANA